MCFAPNYEAPCEWQAWTEAVQPHLIFSTCGKLNCPTNKCGNKVSYSFVLSQLLETCMKNCGTKFHYVAADERLFKILHRLAKAVGKTRHS